MASGLEKAILRMGPIEIHWVGLALGLGYLAAGAVGRRWAHRRGFSPWAWWGMTMLMMVVVLVGARLGYALMHWSHFINHPTELWRLPITGLSFYGGMLAGLGLLAVVARRQASSFWELADLVALPYITGLLVAVLMWRSPVAWAGLPPWVSLIGDLAYVSGIYGVLWMVGVKQRLGFVDGELFLLAIIGDSLLRLIVGSATALALPAGWLSTGVAHLAHLLTFMVAFALLRVRTGRWEPFARERSEGTPQVPPLSRWVGWLAIYGFIVTAHVAFRVVAH